MLDKLSASRKRPGNYYSSEDGFLSKFLSVFIDSCLKEAVIARNKSPKVYRICHKLSCCPCGNENMNQNQVVLNLCHLDHVNSNFGTEGHQFHIHHTVAVRFTCIDLDPVQFQVKYRLTRHPFPKGKADCGYVLVT